jgi:predicted RNA-binding Zn ribbon-like protein
VNTHDALADPPDYLTPQLAGQLAGQHGQPDLARTLPEAGLAALRVLRTRCYLVFAGPDDAAKTAALDTLLRYVDARARFHPDLGLIAVAADGDPVRRLGVVCADALARAMAVGGPGRFGVCAAHPCVCGYVDRTRAGRQRFCCQLCNDRTAAAAYRDRRRSTNPSTA